MELTNLNTHFKPRYFKTREDWEQYASWLKQQMLVSLGLAPFPEKTPLNTQIFGHWEGSGYSCEKVCFESIPGFFVTGNLFRPLEAISEQAPIILCPHGHWPDGRLHDRDHRGSVILRCIQLAKMGASVLSYDMIGYNDSCQLDHRGLEMDESYGLSMMGLQTWNSIRALDLLQELEGVDPEKVGVTGTSGGGTQTFILAAVDDRVKVAAPICMISYHMQGGCVCENAPLLRVNATSVDIARLFAPKPMFMGSCTQDWTKLTAEEELPAIKHIYDFYDATDKLAHHHVDFEHNYNQEMREHVYGFFNKFLFGGNSIEPIPEPEPAAEPARPPMRDRMVWWGREAPGEISPEQMKTMWRSRMEKSLTPCFSDPDSTQQLINLLPFTIVLTPESVQQFTNANPETVGLEIDGEVLTVLPVRPEYTNQLEAINLSHCYNRTVFANRVHEILACVRDNPEIKEIHGKGEAGPACLMAVALTNRLKRAEIDMCNMDPKNDLDWKRLMDTPSIRQIGGIQTLLAATKQKEVKLLNLN